MGEDLVVTPYGIVPLRRIVAFYRRSARNPDVGFGTPNRIHYRNALRRTIREYRDRGPLSRMENVA